MDIDGRPRRLIVAGVVCLLADVPAEAAFPGKNGKIVFATNRDGTFNSEIYVMNADGSGVSRLTDDPGFDFDPVWSPDGSRIAFASDRDGDYEIYVMNADGSNVTALTDDPSSDEYPAWSPDGKRIAFSSRRANLLHQIYVMNADGTGQTRLTVTSNHERRPAWSPDGTRIAFQSERTGNGDLYVMNVDGSGQTRLTTSQRPDVQPDWSPDATKIAFQSDPMLNSGIYMINPDGTGLTQVVNNPATHEFSPGWSPDGTKFAFTANPVLFHEIFVMNPDGSGWTQITDNSASDGSPDWQPLPLLISPGSGTFVTTQQVDLTLVLTKPGVAMTGLNATLDGQDVSAPLLACLVSGNLAFGRTYRCPNLSGATVGPGQHSLIVALDLSDGTSVSDTATYTVIANTEALDRPSAGPGSRRGGPRPSLTISPGSSLGVLSQQVDLTLIFTGAGVAVTAVSGTLDGQDISAHLSSCLQPGTHASGRTFRCPGTGGDTIGTGPHKLAISLALSDGSIVSDTAYYTVLANTEP